MSDLLEEFEDGVLTLTMNRPEARNAMSGPMMMALKESVFRAADDPEVRCLVLTGAGSAFCAGGDVKGFASGSGGEKRDPPTQESRVQSLRQGMEISRQLHVMPKPTLAIIPGPAAGAGLSLALACDLRFALATAKITTAFSKIGVSGDFGSSYFLPQIVGSAKARELFFTADVISGQEAFDLGIVTKVANAETFEEQSKAYARYLAGLPTVALGYMKKNLNAAQNATLSDVFDLEAAHMIRTFMTEDHKAAASAFVQKAAPGCLWASKVSGEGNSVGEQYTIYGSQLSYFSRKLEAALIFYGADFIFCTKTSEVAPEVEARSGTRQVPVLLTPENWMIADTTPVIRMLDGRFPTPALFPRGPLGVLTQIVEDYFDEWVARTMVHYRWHYEESAVFASEKMARGQADVAARLRSWGPRACRATGTESAHQMQCAEDEYHRVMAAAERQLAKTRFLLGDRPTAVDCVVLGGLRAHTLMDPTPKSQMSLYPRVTRWSETQADAWDGDGELLSFPESSDFAQFILAEMATTYQPFVLGNCSALARGEKFFLAQIYGEDVSYLCRPYPELSRKMIVAQLANLNRHDRAVVADWLSKQQLALCFS